MLRVDFPQSMCALIVLASVLTATILRGLIDIILGEQVAYSPFYPAVMFTALCCGLRWGLVATGLSALAASFWISPVWRPIITEISDLAGMVLFLIVCGLIVWLAARVRDHRRELEKAAEERQRLLIREQKARKEAERANRAKDDFLAAVTHELRNPLSSILGWAQLLREHQLSDDEVHTALESIERSARIQTQLVNDLLELSCSRMGKLHLDVRPIMFSDVVKSAVQTVVPAAAAKSVTIVAPRDQAVGPVLADRDRLHQIVWNLLSNALKFTPSDGTIRVDVIDHGDRAELLVEDTGEGIDPAFLPKIFDRFQQEDGKRHSGGLGLGLAIVKELAELHGGSVRVSSEGKGRGARFAVVLPKFSVPAVAAPESDDSSHPPSVPAANALAGKRVLVVDDDPDARAVVERVLACHGAEAICAGSAGEADELIKRRRPDVLISDLAMPGVDGFALIRQVRRLEMAAASIPAVALTACSTADDRNRALASGFQVHLGKPVEPQELVDAVVELAVTK